MSSLYASSWMPSDHADPHPSLQVCGSHHPGGGIQASGHPQALLCQPKVKSFPRCHLKVNPSFCHRNLNPSLNSSCTFNFYFPLAFPSLSL